MNYSRAIAPILYGGECDDTTGDPDFFQAQAVVTNANSATIAEVLQAEPI